MYGEVTGERPVGTQGNNDILTEPGAPTESDADRGPAEPGTDEFDAEEGPSEPEAEEPLAPSAVETVDNEASVDLQGI